VQGARILGQHRIVLRGFGVGEDRGKFNQLTEYFRISRKALRTLNTPLVADETLLEQCWTTCVPWDTLSSDLVGIWLPITVRIVKIDVHQASSSLVQQYFP
jgi:hypothetical protein